MCLMHGTGSCLHSHNCLSLAAAQFQTQHMFILTSVRSGLSRTGIAAWPFDMQSFPFAYLDSGYTHSARIALSNNKLSAPCTRLLNFQLHSAHRSFDVWARIAKHILSEVVGR